MDGLGQPSVYVVENNLMYQNPVWTSPGHVENKWIRVQLALNPTKYKVSQSRMGVKSIKILYESKSMNHTVFQHFHRL